MENTFFYSQGNKAGKEAEISDSEKEKRDMGKETIDFGVLEKEVENIRAMYEEMINGETSDKRREQLVNELLRHQKQDESFSTIDDYQIDSDCVVYYALIPTYCATAALMYADLMNPLTNDKRMAMLSGLRFAAELRGFIGHGFDATNDLLEAINIYKKAGLYKWLRKNDGIAKEFQRTIIKRVMEMKEALADGRVYAGWDEDYTERFTREVEDFEREMYDYVWYVSYGSNLSRERFMRYINGCRDTSEPVDDKAGIYNFSMYFASKTSIWGDGKGGAAFIDEKRKGMTYCRMYKIKREQFEEIMRREGSNYTRRIDLDPKMSEDCPCYTFTSATILEDINVPSKEYYDTILTGLKEMYPETSETLLRYYLTSRCMTDEDITALKQIRLSEHAIRNCDITGIRTKKKHGETIKRLEKLGLIQEDSRSKRNGLKINDHDALMFTVKEMREIIDMIIIGATMRGEY